MKNIFIIPGYGVAKNIFKDEQQKRYLGLVFNHIYQICLETKQNSPLIIFCGGPTDLFKPYKRTEAGEMKKFFIFLAKRDFVKKYTKNWRYALEQKSLSTMENILGAERIARKIAGQKKFYIFVEKTRERKMNILAKKIIKRNFKVIPIDFDLSLNRYYDPEFLKKKEDWDIKMASKSLKDKKFFDQYRKTLEQRIKYYREAGSKKHRETIYQWWERKMKEM